MQSQFGRSIMDSGLNIYPGRSGGFSREVFLVSEAAVSCVADSGIACKRDVTRPQGSEYGYAVVPASLVVDQVDIKSLDAAYIFDHFSFETRINDGQNCIDHEYAVALVKIKPKACSALDMGDVKDLVICGKPVCFASFKVSGGVLMKEVEEVFFNVELSNFYAPLNSRNSNKSFLMASSIGVFLSRWINEKSKAAYYNTSKVYSNVDARMVSHDFLMSVSYFLDGFNHLESS